MRRRNFCRSFLSALLVIMFILTSMTTSILMSRQQILAAADSENKKESSMIDTILNLIGEKGSSIIKDNLPTVGDFLCAQIFDEFGIDYTDSYTKEIKEINVQLAQINTKLTQIAENLNKQTSQDTMIDFYSSLRVFSNTVYPIYTGYNDLLIEEKSKKISSEDAQKLETAFYNEHLKNIVFGSALSTGDLYTQLKNLLDLVVLPNPTTKNLSLMQHYNITYEHMWAFDTQSFAPKKEFLKYVSATIMEGLTLYAFQNSYESSHSLSPTVYKERWKLISLSAKDALDYLQKEIKAVEAEEKLREDTNTAFHYSTGIELSRDMYVNKFYDKSSRFMYASSRSSSRQGNTRFVVIKGLNNNSFIDTIYNEYNQYKVNYNKGNDFKISDFLKSAGFKCSDWNANLYRYQYMKSEGSTFTNEYYRFYTSYLSSNDATNNVADWGYLKYKVFGSPTPCYNDSRYNSYMAFVNKDGVLVGNYDTIYNDNGNTTVDAIYSMIRNGCVGSSSNYGKVR